MSRDIKIGLAAFIVFLGLGLLLMRSNLLPIEWIGASCLALASIVVFLGLMEYVVLRALGVFRLGALVRVTYYEALLQPFTLIVLAIGIVCIAAGSFMPFFTLSEDSKMYRDVATQFVLLFPLAIMVFAAGKVVDEEIENRTMLTLMSKPIARWQVIVGKYLGVVCLVLVAVVVLGIMAGTSSYMRYFDDQRIDFMVARESPKETKDLLWANHKAILGMMPLMTLEFLQIATLAAISVAISTRYGLALNMTVVALLYVVANLTRGIHDFNLAGDTSWQGWQWLAEHASYVLPYLTNFDLSPVLIYGNFIYRDDVPNITQTLGQIWQYVALAGVYAVLYVGAALCIAIAMFRTRELT